VVVDRLTVTSTLRLFIKKWFYLSIVLINLYPIDVDPPR